MKVEHQDVETIRIVAVAESLEIDIGNAEEFKLAVLDAIGESENIILDATLVEFFDSAGMASLLSVHKRLKARGGELYIAGLNQAIMEIFRMVGFDVVFKTFQDVPQALTAVRGGS
jgi:anti-sigma B factor antagonist